jgi:hypothetical protein
VTPQEKCRIKVEVAPLKVTEWEVNNAQTQNQRIKFKTEQGHWFKLDREHPLTLFQKSDEEFPIVLVRNDLHAIITRNAYYQMAELVEEFTPDTLLGAELIGSERDHFLGIRSDNCVFALGHPD